MATVRSEAVRATFSALGSVFSMGLNRLMIRSSSSSCEIRFLGSVWPEQEASVRTVKAARQAAIRLLLILPFVC